MRAAELMSIELTAMILPTKWVPFPNMAESPTAQKTLQAAPGELITRTLLFGAVVSVDPSWKMKTARESPWASSVTVRVSLIFSDDL